MIWSLSFTGRVLPGPDRVSLARSARPGLLGLLLGALLAVSGPGRAAEPLDYDFKLIGVEGGLADLIRQSSALAQRRAPVPRTLAGLRSRLNGDADTIRKVLRSEGYYGHRILTRIDRTKDPVQVRVEILKGPAYTLKQVVIALPEGDYEALGEVREEMGLEIGSRAVASKIISAEQRLIQAFPEHGYPLAELKPRQVVVGHAERGVWVSYQVEPGPRLAFGELSFPDTAGVDESFLRRLVRWDEGTIYDDSKLETYRRDLSRTGLFGLVQADYGEPSDGKLPIAIKLNKVPRRTFALGASYSTTEGPGAEVSWEHRNLLRQAETFRVTVIGALIEQGVRVTFDKPHFRRLDQDLLLNTELFREDTDAFRALRATVGAFLARPLGGPWSGRFGLEVEAADVEDFSAVAAADLPPGEQPSTIDGSDFFVLGALPVSVSFDTTDSLLDPRDGVRFTLRTAPTGVTTGRQFGYFKNEILGSAYVPFDSAKRYVLALRAHLGSIAGVDTGSVPANRRFFAGGGGSIRGFNFQEVGPANAEGISTGGRSLAEAAIEFRWQAFGDFGIVPFVDIGNVYTEPVPQFTGLRAGIGLGLRYYTSFGPIRLDLATPLDRQPEDPPVQVYISIGQSF